MPLEMYPENVVTAGNRNFPTAELYHEVWEGLWPRNPTGWVFLGRAVHILGEALFSDWQRHTPYGLLPDVNVGVEWEDEKVSEEDQRQYANWLINTRGNDSSYIFKTNRPFDYLDCSPDLDAETERYWDLACDLSQEEWSIGLGNRRMFREVQLRMVQEAEAGILVIGSRPIHGGEPTTHSRDWWFTDHYENRFRSLTINPNDPFAINVPEKSVGHHLFVDADSLATLISRIPAHGEVGSAYPGSENLSPYMRLMLEVAEYLKISPSKQPVKTSVLGEIQSRWIAYGLPPSQNLQASMASLMRAPESQAGRARKVV